MPARVAASLESLPGRYRGCDPGGIRYRLVVGSTVRDVICGEQCTVEQPSGTAGVEIHMSPATWHAIEAGRMSGIDAFAAHKLTIRGSIEAALAFEPCFDRPHAGATRYSLGAVKAGKLGVSALQAGDPGAPVLLMLHGLGATKASWLTIVPELARSFRVVAVDLPGFGASSKPLAPYDAPWQARRVRDLLDELGVASAFVAGNSMGGRIAMELAMRAPERVEAIACLCPATAFSRRPFLRFVKLLRPELGVLAGRLPRKQLIDQLRTLFADPRRVPQDWYEAAIDEFLATWRSPRARIAFSRALRNIYLDEPYGEMGLWRRLEALETPALYIYGRRDVLITHRFAPKVSRHLPHAEVLVWNDCGHVPQIEHPARTAAALRSFFDAAAGEVPRPREAARR